jgi:hypothetical protein
MVGTWRRKKPHLGIVELAVDPADVDRERYPVRIRLTRPLTSYEADGLAVASPGTQVDGDTLVVPDAKLDDIAHEQATWASLLERVESLGDELEGENLVADHRRIEEQARHGSHLTGQHENDRGLH